MKVTDLWSPGRKTTTSFEFFPARTPKAAEAQEKTIDSLAACNPDFASVTFGAGGSTRDGSRQLVESLKHRRKLEVVAYFAGYGLGPDDIVSVLDAYQALGVENLLVVRGDPPHEEGEFKPHPDSFAHASDLLKFIRPRYRFCLGVAGYPEKHIQAPSPEKDLEHLRLKVDLGAEFVICNYFYDNRYYFGFVERCRAAGLRVPIVPGLMPIFSVKMMETLAALCGATLTDEVRRGIAALPEGDKDALVAFGIEFAARQARGLLQGGAPGLHFYTMNQSRSTAGILDRLRGG